MLLLIFIYFLFQHADELGEGAALHGSILHFLQDLFTSSIKKCFPQLTDFTCSVTRSTTEKFGDYQCNSAMNIAQVKYPDFFIIVVCSTNS